MRREKQEVLAAPVNPADALVGASPLRRLLLLLLLPPPPLLPRLHLHQQAMVVYQLVTGMNLELFGVNSCPVMAKVQVTY